MLRKCHSDDDSSLSNDECMSETESRREQKRRRFFATKIVRSERIHSVDKVVIPRWLLTTDDE